MSLSAAASRWLRDDFKPRRIVALLTAALALTYLCGVLLTAGVHQPSVKGDARSYFAYLPSLVLDRDIDLANQFAEPPGPQLGAEGLAVPPGKQFQEELLHEAGIRWKFRR